MGKILNLIEGNMNGDAWEDLCVRCYRMKYQEQHYVAIPAVHKGDAGIEGYTKSGIVHQCYCPERSYSDSELYDHQRDKLSADIKKLMENGSRMKSLGIPPIHEWHFNIPEYKDSRILMHATAKQAEVLSERSKKPSIYSHIADDFQIIIKIAEDLAPEISNIIRTTITNNRINLAVQHTSSPDWTKCDLNADVLCFAGHKTLMGPFGIGGFLIKHGITLKKVLTGGTGSASLTLDMPEEAPGRYEASSTNVVAIAGLNASLKGLDINEHRKTLCELTEYLLEALNSIPSVNLMGTFNTDKTLGIVSFVVEGYQSDEVGIILDDEYDIAVRTGYHCAPYIHDYLGDKPYHGTIRIGIGQFNTKEDIDALISAIKSL